MAAANQAIACFHAIHAIAMVNAADSGRLGSTGRLIAER
jgi:hypothetical protein